MADEPVIPSTSLPMIPAAQLDRLIAELPQPPAPVEFGIEWWAHTLSNVPRSIQLRGEGSWGRLDVTNAWFDEMGDMNVLRRHDIDPLFMLCRTCGWTKRELLMRKMDSCGPSPHHVRVCRALFRLGCAVYTLNVSRGASEEEESEWYHHSLTPMVPVVNFKAGFASIRDAQIERPDGSYVEVTTGDYAPPLVPQRVVCDLVVSAVAGFWTKPRSAAVQGLLTAVAGGDLDRCPILADALEESGCELVGLLQALRTT